MRAQPCHNFKLPIITLALSFLCTSVFAIQQDAYYNEQYKKNKTKWVQEDRSIKKKLQALQKRFGKKPNIIYILADDVGWGELGVYGGGKLRGSPTPNLDKMAKSGMKFLQGYAEPSCTPSRIAIMTGRHPVRTGVNGVIWPGQTQGLPPSEVTIAELLKKAGYSTAMFGKWHLGDLDKHSPINQGFDYAYYGLYNGAPFNWLDVEGHYTQDKKTIAGNAFFFDYPGNAEYKKRYGIEVDGIYEHKAGQARKEVMKLSGPTMDKVEATSIKKIVDIVMKSKNAKKPFFIYWATYAAQIAGSPKKGRLLKGVDPKNNTAVQLSMHDTYIKQLFDALEKSGQAENTLIVWYSDNGPMYAFYPNSGYTWLRGGKGDVYEGGVRVPAIAYWKGMIKAGQDPMDLFQITDLYTTAATLAGVENKIPSDRVIDGINQISLLLNGEGFGRRNYIFHYNGDKLGAVRLDEFKMHILGIGGAIPKMEAYNIIRDPGEKFGKVYPYLFLISPIQMMVEGHMKMIKKFPHTVQGPGKKSDEERDIDQSLKNQ